MPYGSYDKDTCNIETQYLKSHLRRHITEEWQHIVTAASMYCEESEDVERDLLESLSRIIALRLPDELKGSVDNFMASIAKQPGNDQEVLNLLQLETIEINYTVNDFLAEFFREQKALVAEDASEERSGPSEETASDAIDELDPLEDDEEPQVEMSLCHKVTKILSWLTEHKEISLNAVATIDSVLSNKLVPVLASVMGEMGGADIDSLGATPAPSEEPPAIKGVGGIPPQAARMRKYSMPPPPPGGALPMGGAMPPPLY